MNCMMRIIHFSFFLHTLLYFFPSSGIHETFVLGRIWGNWFQVPRSCYARISRFIVSEKIRVIKIIQWCSSQKWQAYQISTGNQTCSVMVFGCFAAWRLANCGGTWCLPESLRDDGGLSVCNKKLKCSWIRQQNNDLCHMRMSITGFGLIPISPLAPTT